ncbi:hypothetical protein RRG08_047534 [Elysia crispata]|uniref:Uncharacterized protein n=1 Tax=Elysia crispata TaxID=231223 RepID=A0AAE1D235_9GAST|nr:hypothetical protein RRG08_047533 [Elysia crispata]KAK3752762.1 hypothetical protein RRG08_047534 [Elysia crispata]
METRCSDCWLTSLREISWRPDAVIAGSHHCVRYHGDQMQCSDCWLTSLREISWRPDAVIAGSHHCVRYHGDQMQ